MTSEISRRSFINRTAAAGAMLSSFSILNAQAQGGIKEFKVALVGCGGRGNDAAKNCVAAAKQLGVTIKWVAAADWFEGKAKGFGSRYGIPETQCFGGADGYQKVMASDADIVLLATTPNFRPLHLEAAVEAGKHVFMEKPVAVDPPGARRVIAAGEKAKLKGLSIVAGTQRRHQDRYRQAAHLIHNGAIGDILVGQIYWLGRVPWVKRRDAGQSDADYLVKNWLNWSMMSGDHICEQHVHNIDVANWFIGRNPIVANGFGGRSKRQTGDQYDFFSIDFDYGEGCHVHSMCRQNKGCYSRVGEVFTGTKGSYNGKVKSDSELTIKVPSFPQGNPYVVEHLDLMSGIIKEEPLNEAETVAHATMAAIMGRISAYTGQIVRWSDVMQNEKSKFYNRALIPTAEAFETGNVTAPKDDVISIPPA
ncbi:MAG: Gfo/Idh/MocA family oxidoreductase [Verrucomicrobia bacterium]|nr:Gfo/Idh/MocA family oxidoreductase [Verrucomicrobiota bacterium]MBT7065205.1 Gfo/Idh/MocA family oxidoreductase [Verrucomicrobiota bacterium]MBT7700905.1 Gfo/Idh/MocA family oxidoreductase [Verrucomicrobiota bacterium]